ncbi:hypothetical protein FSP39_020131 [Pinctada imbricata]|uniref:Sec20 C-terminal domain-containing protein n=1 Tax=Pinctada imbricata TaxID=66713 RepID=A0AA89BW75_PINIB|nr:hypothetical protein FSP39_020131 [Pinctada imbricata]
MATEDIQVRLCLQEIVKLDLEIKALIQDIQECATTSEILEDINADAQAKVSKLRHKIQDLEQLGREQEKSSVRQIIQKDVDSHRQRLSNTISTLRQTNLATQFAIDKSEKEQLLNGGSSVRQRRLQTKESISKTATDITQSLMGLNRKLAEQVVQSEDTKATLMRSSDTITTTHDELRNMTGHIANSKKLLSKYGRRQITDKLLIFLALVFFFASVLYIVKKRVW